MKIGKKRDEDSEREKKIVKDEVTRGRDEDT
jgi:hypothetical protein